jgi:uncharacterized protein (DUF885 family)
LGGFIPSISARLCKIRACPFTDCLRDKPGKYSITSIGISSGTVFPALPKQTSIAKERLSPEQQIDYEVLQYQIKLNLERIKLEKIWSAAPPSAIPTEGLSTVPNGKAWYTYFLKKWVDQSVSPEQLFQFGLKEIHKVKGAMRDIQIASGMDSISFQEHLNHPDFFYPDVESTHAAFESIKTVVNREAASFFTETTKTPKVNIARSTNPAMGQVPGYYNQGTFYYTFFDRPFNKRQIVWLYLHEAIPGHHYERHYSRQLERSPITGLFRYPCYAEGWAARSCLKMLSDKDE